MQVVDQPRFGELWQSYDPFRDIGETKPGADLVDNSGANIKSFVQRHPGENKSYVVDVVSTQASRLCSVGVVRMRAFPRFTEAQNHR